MRGFCFFFWENNNESHREESKQTWMKTSNLTTTHHWSISSYAWKLTKFSKSVGIRTLHVQKWLGQNYLELIITHGFYFVDTRLKKKKKIPHCLSLIKLINFKILLVVNTFFKEIFNLCRPLLIITLYLQIKISINFLCRWVN